MKMLKILLPTCLMIIAAILLTASDRPFNAGPTDDPWLGRWLLTTEDFELTKLNKAFVEGTILRVMPYGGHYVIIVDKGTKLGLENRAAYPAILKDDVLYIADGENGMSPMILNEAGDRLFYFAEFERIGE